jgi:copper(I)-binding protein
VILSSRRGILPRSIVIVAAVALGPVIAGCEAGNNAPTLQWHQPTNGTFHAVGKHLTISNAFVLGAPIGRTLHAGQSAGFFLGLVNTGTPDRLLAIKAPGVAQKVVLPGHGIALRSLSRVLLAGPAPRIILQHLLRPLAGGTVIKLYLKFKNAGSTRLYVPVLPKSSNYMTYSPPALSPSASPSVSNSKTGTASPTPSPSSSG